MKNCPYCKASGNFYFNPQITQITQISPCLATGIEIMEKLTDLISGGRVLWGPSLDVIARKE
jgi:hypothetical protein